MFFSKKVLFGSLAALATTTVVVGTAVGVSVSQNSVTSDKGGEETGDGSGSGQGNWSPNTNPGPTNVTVNLEELASKIKEENIVVKIQNGPEGVNSSMTIPTANLYAFNVDAPELALNGVNLPGGVSATFSLTSDQNTVPHMNNGMLDVEVTLKNEQSNPKEHKTTVKLTKFKKVDVEKNFASLFEDNTNFVLKIEPAAQESQQQYADLTTLNNQSVTVQPVPAAGPSRSVREVDDERERAAEELPAAEPVAQQNTTTGLTVWLNKDSTKMSHTEGITVKGQAKLEKITGESNGTKAYFHLVSKDANNRLKLVKKGTGDDASVEVAIAEIKTTNLLATDVSVVPTMVNDEQQEQYVTALKGLGMEAGQTDKKYGTDNPDPNLNRDLSVNLGDTSTANQLFVKPYTVLRPKAEQEPEEQMVNLPLSVVVSFGEKDYVTSFRTDEKTQEEQLRAAGFNFGLYTKKLTSEEQNIDAKVITDMKASLVTVFKSDNYKTPAMKPTSGMPMSFMDKQVNKDMLGTGFAIKLMKATEEVQKTENWLAFASYSYGGIMEQKVLFTPSISLIRVESPTPIS